MISIIIYILPGNFGVFLHLKSGKILYTAYVMRVTKDKKLPRSALAIAFVVTLVGVSLGQVFAFTVSKPYFVTNGSDIFTGGWFDDQASNTPCTSSGNFQAPSGYSPSVTGGYNGAIMAFSDTAARAGARSDLGAFALGYIEAEQPPPTNLYGFYSGPAGANPPPPGSRSLSFANSKSFNSNYLGGLFQGSPAKNAGSCIPDYFGTKKSISSPPRAWTAGDFSTSGQFTYGGGNLTVGANRIVPASTNLAIFVSGDLYIDQNITYGAHIASTSPKFVVVVQGNIYVGSNVSQLDGWYIAQPDNKNAQGEFWSCHDGSFRTLPTDQWVRQNCLTPLTINGAITAKQVNLGRIDPVGTSLPATPSETVNYTPEMITGGAFFGPQPSPGGQIQSLISLPPIF